MGVIMIVPESAGGTGRWLRVVTFAIGVGVVAHAQTQQPPEQPAASEPAASEPVDAESQPVFRAGITPVTTDVIVRDEDGVFIADLAAEEFIVREDGVAQEVVSLVLVHGGRVFNQLAPRQLCEKASSFRRPVGRTTRLGGLSSCSSTTCICRRA